MDVLTHSIANKTIDDFLKNDSNYLFETDAGYVAILASPEIRPFSMFHPFYIKPDEIRECWLIKDVFRKWAGKFRVISIVPSHRVNLFMHKLSDIVKDEKKISVRSA